MSTTDDDTPARDVDPIPDLIAQGAGHASSLNISRSDGSAGLAARWITRAVSVLSALRDELRVRDDRLAAWRTTALAYDALSRKDYWAWQDQDDRPEGLTCHVVMTADQLRAILARGAAARTRRGDTTVAQELRDHQAARDGMPGPDEFSHLPERSA